MNRIIKISAYVLAGVMAFASCQKTPELVTTDVGPVMEVLECDIDAFMGESISFAVSMEDPIPLSTLKAQLFFDKDVVGEVSIRTKKNGVYAGTIEVPFLKDIPDGTASLVFTGQNIQFGTTETTVPVKVSRPDFEYLTLWVNQRDYRMERVDKNRYECKGEFPREFEGYIESAPFGELGNVITFGWSNAAVAPGTTKAIPFSSTSSDITVSLNTFTFDAGPFVIYTISVNDVAAEKVSDGGVIYYTYDTMPLKQGMELDLSIKVNGEDELDKWYIDPDYVNVTDKGMNFNAVDGYYTVRFDVEYKYVTIQKVNEKGESASFADDGILYLLGWGGAYPAMANQFSWSLGNGWGMAEVKDNVYQFSGKAVPESSVEMGGHFRTDYIDIKYFGTKNSWAPEAGKIFDGTTESKVTLTEASKQWVKLNGTNINLADGTKLEEGAMYVLTVDLSTKGEEVIDFVKKQ